MANHSEQKTYQHTSVLFHESVDILSPMLGSTLIDCTLGGGGHTSLMLEKVGPTGRVVAFDRDLKAIDNAKAKLSSSLASGTLEIVHATFGDILKHAEKLNLVGAVSGVLADIGVSSHHLDEDSRGFSFMHDGPLDMRMDQTSGITAAEFLRHADEKDIADVIWKYGEEPKSRFIARLICEIRTKSPLTTTKQLADLISSKVIWKEASRKHPATRTFQALRIHVNDELGQLKQLLKDAPKILAPGGILAIITFHSLEDRLVKESMLEMSGKTKRQSIPRDLPLTDAQVSQMSASQGTILKPFPVAPNEQEIRDNPRARSAKLRAIRFQ